MDNEASCRKRAKEAAEIEDEQSAGQDGLADRCKRMAETGGGSTNEEGGNVSNAALSAYPLIAGGVAWILIAIIGRFSARRNE